ADILQRRTDLTPQQHFALGRYWLDKGDTPRGVAELTTASDRTIRVGRVQSRIVRYLRDELAAVPGVTVIDPEPIFLRKNGVDVLGEETLSDWCHLTVETGFALAQLIADAMEPTLAARLGPPAAAPESLADFLAGYGHISKRMPDPAHGGLVLLMASPS